MQGEFATRKRVDLNLHKIAKNAQRRLIRIARKLIFDTFSELMISEQDDLFGEAKVPGAEPVHEGAYGADPIRPRQTSRLLGVNRDKPTSGS
jgi:hypothetical protein